jgi:hypothetical protein
MAEDPRPSRPRLAEEVVRVRGGVHQRLLPGLACRRYTIQPLAELYGGCVVALKVSAPPRSRLAPRGRIVG